MCDCGCGKCETKSTALVLNESKAPRTILSEGLKYHMDNNIPLIENVYKAGSRKYFDLFAEARSLYSRGILEFTNKNDIKILTETNLGHFGISDGKRVPLDYPIKEGTFNTDNHVATFDGNDGYAEVYKKADGSFYIVVGGDQDYDMTATDAKDVAAKLKRDGYTRLQAGELNEKLQRPIPQDTPNEFAYLDFKKWAYLKRGKIKKQMQSLQGDSSRIFRAMALVWETWANHKAKEWSKITDPNKFGRALVVMMVKDNLVFDKAAWEKTNNILHIKENDRNVIDMDRVFMHGKDQDEYRKDEREVGNKINKARAKAHFKMGEKIAVVHKVTKNVMPIEDIRQIDTFDTNKYDFAYLNENKLLKQDALSPAEYQKAKKLKGFDPKNYLWDKKQGLHLIRKMSEGKVNENQGTLSSNMLDYADHYHMELVDSMKGVSTFPDKRTEGFYIRFPHYNGPDWTGATFGKDVSDRIKKSKGAAIAAANKTYDKFQDYIEDYDITDSKSGVYGDVWLWVMPKDKNIKEEEWSEDFGELEETN